MGMLDMLFGGQQAGGPPRPLGILGGMGAAMSPNSYEAAQKRQEQMATYKAMQTYQSMPPEVQSALAQNPQLMSQLGPAYLPSGPQIQMMTDQSGMTYPIQITNPGGGAGHGVGMSGIPIGEPPGTTTSPAQATAAPVGPQQGAPAGTAPLPQKTSLGGMPGSTQDVQNRIQQAQAAGADPFSVLPAGDAELARAVHDGRMTLKDVADRRGNNVKTRVEMAITAIDPKWDANKAEAINGYRKSYATPSGQGGIYFQRQAYDASLEHLNSTLDAAIAMNPEDSPIAPLSNISNRMRGLGGEQASKIRDFNSRVGILAPETDKYLGGKPATDTGTKLQTDKWDQNSTSREFAATGQAYLEMLEGKRRAMEAERDSTFGNPEVSKAFPLDDPRKEMLRAQIQAKIDYLKKKGEAAAAAGGGRAKSPDTPAPAPQSGAQPKDGGGIVDSSEYFK